MDDEKFPLYHGFWCYTHDYQITDELTDNDRTDAAVKARMSEIAEAHRGPTCDIKYWQSHRCHNCHPLPN